MRIKLFFILSLSIALTGCAAIHTTQKIQTMPIVQTTPPGRIGLELAPATLGKSISLQQHLTVQHPGRTDELDTVLEIDSHHLDLAGLMLGHRIMTIHYDGKILQTWRDPRLPPQISGQNVLEDIELTLWPVNVIRKALPTGWNIQSYKKQRVIFLNKLPIITINYPNGQNNINTVILKNLRYHYQLTIQSTNN